MPVRETVRHLVAVHEERPAELTARLRAEPCQQRGGRSAAAAKERGIEELRVLRDGAVRLAVEEAAPERRGAGNEPDVDVVPPPRAETALELLIDAVAGRHHSSSSCRVVTPHVIPQRIVS